VAVLVNVIAAYLVFTLTATALAKLTRFRAFSFDLALDLVMPYPRAKALAAAVCGAELLLAGAVVAHAAPRVTGPALAMLLIAFSVHRIRVYASTASSHCSCGGQRQAIDTRTALTGSVVANVVLAAFAVGWGLGASPGRAGAVWAALGALPPLAVLVAARLTRPRPRRLPAPRRPVPGTCAHRPAA
jgi:hypothetical protein